MTGAMASATGGTLYDKPSPAEIALHRELGTKFQLIFVVVNVANLTATNGASKGNPYALSLIPATKRGSIQIADIDTVAALDIQKMLSTFEPAFLGYDPFTGNPSLFGPLCSFLEKGLKNTFPDKLGIVIGQYFLALDYKREDVITSPAGFPSEKAESKYQAHRANLLFTPFHNLIPRRVWGAGSPIELFLMQEMIAIGLNPIPQMLIYEDGATFPSLYHLWSDIDFRYSASLISEVDFYFPESRVAVFCDSSKHHSRPKDVAKDQRIDEKLGKISIKSIRVRGPQILRDLKSAGAIVAAAV